MFFNNPLRSYKKKQKHREYHCLLIRFHGGGEVRSHSRMQFVGNEVYGINAPYYCRRRCSVVGDDPIWITNWLDLWKRCCQLTSTGISFSIRNYKNTSYQLPTSIEKRNIFSIVFVDIILEIFVHFSIPKSHEICGRSNDRMLLTFAFTAHYKHYVACF